MPPAATHAETAGATGTHIAQAHVASANRGSSPAALRGHEGGATARAPKVVPGRALSAVLTDRVPTASVAARTVAV
jgi:hypothetical protein